MGGGVGMGNTCKSMADSFQCMTKPTTIKNKQTKKRLTHGAVKILNFSLIHLIHLFFKG